MDTGARTSEIAGADAPQLIAGTIDAVRSWDLIREVGGGRVMLGSIAQSLVWPLGAVSAECEASSHVGSGVPGPACGCGLYAHHADALELELLEYAEEVGEVVGAIEAWGRIEVHETGIRAERARIRTLFIEPGCSPERAELVAMAASTYGVEVHPFTSQTSIERYAGELRGLDDVFVERLFAPSQRHVLQPQARGYISRRGTPVGGMGFVPAANPVAPSRFAREHATATLGLEYLRVAGAKHHRRALQLRAFDPGAELALAPEPDNAHDPNAIAVMDAARTHRVGYVPRGLAAGIGTRLAAGRIAAVRSAWQWRDLATGRRTGLHILISASPNVEFVGTEQLELGGGS